jgi:hypothetical protein
MTQPNQFAALRRLAAAAMLICLQSWLAACAQASCGDYVLVDRLHSAASLHGAMDGDSPRDQSGSDAASSDSHSPRRLPCNGPQCSKRSLPPVAPEPPAAVSPVRHDLSCSGPSGLTLAARSSRLIAIEVRVYAVFRCDPILRPPRPISPALA